MATAHDARGAGADDAGGVSSRDGSARCVPSVGLTAHRDLVPDDDTRLRCRSGAFLRLQEQFPDLPLRLMSALTEGGDQGGRRKRWDWHRTGGALPGPGGVRTRLPGRRVDRALPPLLARPRPVRPLARAATRRPCASAARCAIASTRSGMFVSSHCQVLLALWAGAPSAAPAGPRGRRIHLRNAMPRLQRR